MIPKGFQAIRGTFQLVQAVVTFNCSPYVCLMLDRPTNNLHPCGVFIYLPFCFWTLKNAFCLVNMIVYPYHTVSAKKSCHFSVPLQTTIFVMMSTKHPYKLL